MTTLRQLQDDILGKLEGETFFGQIPVVLMRKLEPALEPEQQSPWLKEKGGCTGLAVIIEMPMVRNVDPDLGGPQMIAQISLLVLESPAINNTGSTAEECALELATILHHWQINDLGLIVADPDLVVPDGTIADLVAYHVNFTLRLPQSQTERTGQVSAEHTDGLLTLTCSDSDAEIYFTLDESFPSKTLGQLYEAPVPVPAGTVVRAAAWASGKTGSDIYRGLIS